jgi:hypothetical protein
MADYQLDIFEAIDARMTTYMASGQALEDIVTCHVSYDQNDIPPDFGAYPPICLIEQAGEMNSDVISIPAIMSRHAFPVRWQIFTEHANYDVDHKAAELMKLVKIVFSQWQLGISNLLVSAPVMRLGIPGRAEFAQLMNGGAEMTITYEYVDVSALPTS